LGRNDKTISYLAKTKKKTEASVYNLIDGEYILLGTVPLDPQNPAADLNQFGDTIKSDDFGFALDAYSAETLDGKNINITYKERTLSHTVQKKGKSGEYTFQLGFGG